jgi:cobalamin biosynthesis Mg chelatase CobN
MTSRKNHQADATGHAVAIAQWDDDGGASMSPRSYTGAEISNDVSSKRRLAGDERFERARVPHYPIVMIAGRTKNRRMGTATNSHHRGRSPMELILIIVILVLLFGGGGGYWGRRRGFW